jgi:hypothetical protein
VANTLLDLRKKITHFPSGLNKAATLNKNVSNGKMFRDLRLATSEDKRMRSGANTTEFLVPKVQWQQIRDVARRHGLRTSLTACLRFNYSLFNAQ